MPDVPSSPYAQDAWLAALGAADRGPLAALVAAAKVAPSGAPHASAIAAALGAFAALDAGQDEDGLALARQAVRAVSAGGPREVLCLANLALARARRRAGRPHLATYILTSLAAYAPPAWRAPIAWETALAGGATADAPALRELFAAARAGDRPRFAAAALSFAGAASAKGLLGRDALDLPALLNADRPARPAVAAWRAGDGAAVPGGFHGLGADPAGDGAGAAPVIVLADPDRPGRRVLAPGAALAGAASRVSLDDGQLRCVAGIAALALAGPAGVDKTAFFTSVYALTFNPRLHKGVLDVLIHRMRKVAEPAGEIAREGNRLTLRLARAILVPDPRGVAQGEARVVRYLAAAGAVTTQEAAAALRVPLRTVQAALQQLVGDGACKSLREGRAVRYRLEDTTFTPSGDRAALALLGRVSPP